jgi:sugar lactone lactonase YvrE
MMMIKKIIFILLLFLSLMSYGQWNFFWSHNNELRCLYDNPTYVQELDDGYITEPHGLYFKPDGTRLFVIVSDKYIRQYELSTPWDLSSYTYSYLILLHNNSGNYYGIYISPDGLHMYAVDSSTGRLEEYDLAEAWDIWDFSYADSYVYGGSTFSPVYGCYFSENGEQLIMSGFNTTTSKSALKKWNLTTPWDTSETTVISTNDYDDALMFDIQFNKTGNAFFNVHSSSYIVQKTASPAWSIVNLKHKCNWSTGLTKTMYGIYISPDYKNLYLSNTTDNKIYQYKLFD